jgi:Spy/CpxP family protein refolding chaperone
MVRSGRRDDSRYFFISIIHVLQPGVRPMNPIRCALLAAGMWGAAHGVAMSQTEDRPAPPRGAPESGPRFHVLPPQAQRALNLTPAQDDQIKALEDELHVKMQKILTADQLKQWAEHQPPRPGERSQDRPERTRRGRDEAPPADRTGRESPTREGANREQADAPPRRGRDDNDNKRPPREGRPRGNRDAASDQPAVTRDADTPARGGDTPARGADSSRRGPGRALERMVEQLDLSDEQRVKVQQVLKEHGEMIHDLFRQARVDLLKRMKDVLNDEQYAKFEKTLDQGPPGATRNRGRDNRGQREGRRSAQD